MLIEDTAVREATLAPVLLNEVTKRYGRRRHPVAALDRVSLSFTAGSFTAVLGVSGSGKSTLLQCAAGIERPSSGMVSLCGTDLTKLSHRRQAVLRRRHVGFVFQDPLSSLNPLMPVGRQIGEAYRLLRGRSRADARRRSVELLDQVGIPDPEQRADSYPHQFSGGMRQRVMIAMALSCNPQLLIADEPTTALDVTIQAQILDLLAEMKSRLGMAVMLITHAMGVVAETAQRVAVMYAGRVVEEASVDRLFANPLHPYTQGLIRSIPRVDRNAGKRARLEAIAGVVPSLIDPPPGCRFAPRCKFAAPACTDAVPEIRVVEADHKVACVLY